MTERLRRLDDFRKEVNWNLACGSIADQALAVTSNDGGFPVVVALEEETVATLLGRLKAVGGAANLFVRGSDPDRIRVVSVIDETCAIATPDDYLTGDEGAPDPGATVGMLVDYIQHNPNGVAISDALGHPARVRDAHDVEFAH